MATSAATKGGGSDEAIREAILERWNRISRARVLAELPAPTRIWAISDVHVDCAGNLEHCLRMAARPDDALIVAGDVCPEPLLFEKFFSALVAKFKYVFYAARGAGGRPGARRAVPQVPGNHDLWVSDKHDLGSNSLDKAFQQLLLCDRLGVLTHAVEFSNAVAVVPLLGWRGAARILDASRRRVPSSRDARRGIELLTKSLSAECC